MKLFSFASRARDERDRAALDRAVAAIREEPLPESAETAGHRVWARLSQEMAATEPTGGPHGRIEGCGGFQALLPAYRRGELPEARALLVRDHVQECVACRKWQPAPVVAIRPVAVVKPARSWQSYAAAASVLFAIMTAAWWVYERFGPAPDGERAVVRTIDGELYRVGPAGLRLAKAGDPLGDREVVRTAAGGHAVVALRDGSVVEMGERAEFSVSASRRDTTLHLDQGSVIVQAAKRRSGHLYVTTPDCTVSVTGTVFSVNRGTKGSRVSVVEGEVRVAQGNGEAVLHPGDQMATHASMARVAIREEIAWSRNRDQHVELLNAFGGLQRKLEALPGPTLRYESRLLDLVPQKTVVFGSLPNPGRTLGDTYRLFQQQMQESPALREWWGRQDDDDLKRVEQFVSSVERLGEYLGDEVVFAMAIDGNGGRHSGLAVLADVKRAGLQEYLATEVTRLSEGKAPFRLVDEAGLATLQSDGEEMLALVRPDLLVLSDDPDQLREVQRHAVDPSSRAFAALPFRERLAASYRDGAGLVFGTDLERVTERALRTMPDQRASNVRQLGVNAFRHLIIEQKQVGGQTQQLASVSVSGERQGMASWLGAPGPMATLEYISPEAAVATSFVVKNPALLLDDLLASQAGLGKLLDDIAARTGVRVRDDIAAALGGEITIAVDGPVLPFPAWRLVAEVNDPARLQQAFQRLLQGANTELQQQGKPALALTTETVNGVAFHALRIPLGTTQALEMHYTYAGAHLVAAGSRADVQAALRVRDSGVVLTRSETFRKLLPVDRHANFSAMLYQSLGGTLAPLANAAAAMDGLSEQQRQSLRQVSGQLGPMLITGYGERDRIVLATTGSLLKLGLQMVASPLSVLPGQRERSPATAGTTARR